MTRVCYCYIGLTHFDDSQLPLSSCTTKIGAMVDPSLSLSAFIATWLTPSSLFIFLNLVIATIAISTRFGARPQIRQINHHHELPPTPSLLERVRSFRLIHDPAPTLVAETEFTQQNPRLVRTPSLLERVRSFNFGSYYTNEPPSHDAAEAEYPQPNQLPEPENPTQRQLTRAPSLLQRLQSMNFSHLYKSDSIHGEEKPEPEIEVSDSDPGREGGNVVEMRKSASERRGSPVTREWEEEFEGAVERRRPMTARSETTSFREEEEVDAKADDFINRFKKQLRLQRVDSLLRYREMLRGNSR